MFINLHNHTDHSLFDGYQTITELVTTAKELGQDAIALTEHGTLAGLLEFYLECKKQGIKPILGNEMYFTEFTSVKDRALTYHLILLAKNNTGYENLKKLNQIAYQKDTDNFFYKPRISWENLQQYHEGLICCSACLGSILNTDQGEDWAVRFRDLFGEDFYLEIQPHPIEEQKVYNNFLIGLSKKYNMPLVVTCDAHYSKKSDASSHKLWIGIKKAEYYQTDTNYLWSEKELYEFSEIDREILKQAIDNTVGIANKCDVHIELEGNHYPTYPVTDAQEKIREICRKNWWNKVSIEHSKEYGERFNQELEMLDKCGYTNYLLLTWDFLNWCRENGILIGTGRGSVGGSLVAYILGIHCVDPIKYGLLFERFCNPERVTAPD